MVSHVNNNFGAGARVGATQNRPDSGVTVIGWSNGVPPGTIIGEGVTVYPRFHEDRWPAVVNNGEVLR